jgi:hypothetical protein
MSRQAHRRLEDEVSTKAAVSKILTDIAYKGESSGWSTNDLVLKKAVDDILFKFNVVYTNDFTGTYELNGGK